MDVNVKCTRVSLGGGGKLVLLSTTGKTPCVISVNGHFFCKVKPKKNRKCFVTSRYCCLDLSKTQNRGNLIYIAMKNKNLDHYLDMQLTNQIAVSVE